MGKELFRTEALQAQHEKLYGDTLFTPKPSFIFLTFVAVMIALALVMYGMLGEYTRKEHVVGYLAPTKGLIKIFTPQSGTILEKHVTEGQVVKQGEALLEISSERATASTQRAELDVLERLRARHGRLQHEKIQQKEIDRLASTNLNMRIQSLEAELAQTETQLKFQRNRIANSEQTVKRYEELYATRYVSEATLQDKHVDLLDQRDQLVNLQKTMTNLTRQIQSARTELASSKLKQANNSSAIERQISELEQQLIEMDSRRTVVLTAPTDGTVTTILAEVGQAAQPNFPLLSILPTGAKMQAYLLVPTRAAGFIKLSQPVALRYQAFPYQRFGHYLGQVVQIGRTVIQQNETNLPVNIQEPVYLVTVQLRQQEVLAYGQPMPLKAGMLVDADVWVDRRRLIEWLFEPIFSVTGKI